MTENIDPHGTAGGVTWETRFLRVAWVPILAFILLTGYFNVLGFETVWNPPELIPTLNIVFLTGISFFISAIAARSFLAGRSQAVLLLGCGTLALGLGGIAASLYLAGPGTNSMISVYNTMACIAGLFHLASATGTSISGPRRLKAGWPHLIVTYLAIVAILAAIIFLVHNHIWPVHFIDGSGQTAFGLAILWITAAAFGLSAILLVLDKARDKGYFYRWYGLGLGLIAVGLVGLSLQASLGDPLNWIGRISEYLGTVYMLIAVVSSARASGDWMLPLETALREAEEKLGQLVDRSPDGISMADEKGQIVVWNKSEELITGLRASDVMGKYIWDIQYALIHDREKDSINFETIRAFTQEMLRIGDSMHFNKFNEREISRPDGTCRTIETLTYPVRTSKGYMLGAISRDITERKKAEEALKTSEASLARAQEIARMGSWEWNLATNRVTGSDELYRLFQLDPDPATFFPQYTELLVPEDKKRVLDALNATIENNVPYDIDYCVVLRDGTRKYIHADAVAAHENGRPVKIFGIAFDITERKLVEEALRESQELLHGVIEGIPDPIFAKDRQGHLIMANEATLRVLGKTREEAIGKDDLGLYDDPAVGGTIMENDRRIMESGRTEVVEELGQTPRGYRTFLSTKTPFRNGNGEIIGILGITRDITERKQAEDELNDAKAQAELYLDLMGHDINNMHQIAMNNLELAREILELEGEDRELLLKPLEMMQRSAKLIDNVQKLQKIQKGEIKAESVDIDQVLKRAIDDYQNASGGRITLNNDRGSCFVMANDLLYDVFANLLANAVKYSNGTGAHISVKIDMADEEGRTFFKVSVEDSGPGIPDEMKEKVFNRLQRGETKARGMGLGLYLVKSLVDSYGGRIRAEDRVPGDHTKGCRFIVMLPAI